MLGRLLKRDKGATPVVVPEAEPRQPVVAVAGIPGLDAALTAGDLAGVTAALDQAGTRDAGTELRLRHEAFQRAAAAERPDVVWPPTTDKILASVGGVPEVAAGDLDLDTLIAGVQGHGCLIVRGLFDESTCAGLRERIDLALQHFAARDRALDPQWHTPLSDLNGNPVSPVYRANGYVSFQGQVSVADTPAAADYVLSAFDTAGVPDLVRSYLGEEPALTLEKWVLRRVPPDSNTSWHQDGAFLGADIHTLNLWIALSDCGETASGLDIVAKRFNGIVPTGAYFDWDVAEDVVTEQRGDKPIVSPVFEPGDAVFFDQFLLHRTGIKPGMTEDRYALESWFFTPSSCPSHYSGLLA